MATSFPIYPNCPVCGDPSVNPASLGVRWQWDEQRRRVRGAFTPRAEHTGYAGILHGGILSSLFDECMAWACAVEKATYCVTGELVVRFKAPAAIGVDLAIEAAVVTARGPYVQARSLASAAGTGLVASARATFSTVPREQALVLRRHLRFADGDLDVLELGR
jgi:acyl-coenzyme A thioesterase PaaI-like protein